MAVRFIDLKVVRVGMVLQIVSGHRLTITNIMDLDGNEYSERLIPNDNNMILELDNAEYLWAEIPWNQMDERALIINGDEIEKATSDILN